MCFVMWPYASSLVSANGDGTSYDYHQLELSDPTSLIEYQKSNESILSVPFRLLPEAPIWSQEMANDVVVSAVRSPN